MLDRHIDRLAAGEEVLHEQVAPRATQPSLRHDRAPELVVESTPVLRVQRFGRSASTPCTEEDVVAEEVRRQQWLASRVQGFEDDLRIILLIEVDRDHLKRALHRAKGLVDAILKRSR